MRIIIAPEDTMRNDMDWWIWVLIAAGAVVLVVTARELPSIRRYLRMKSM